MRLAAVIEYDGSAFHGWQSQHGVATVQECVERALSTVANHRVRVTAAGRTDAGVHASAQVIHFDSPAERSARSWVLGANANLPPEVVLVQVRPVSERFHARFEARSRRYRYVVVNRWTRPALLRGLASWQRKPLEEARMREAGRHLLGEHDFSSFRALACQAKSPVRTLHELEVTRRDDRVYIDVRADAFLHHMVRNIAGVLLAVGGGERSPEWPRALLALRDRTRGGVTAPAAGLYLVHVQYDPEHGLPERPVLPAV